MSEKVKIFIVVLVALLAYDLFVKKIVFHTISRFEEGFEEGYE